LFLLVSLNTRRIIYAIPEYAPLLDSCNVTAEGLAKTAKYPEVLDVVFSSLILFYLVLGVNRACVVYFIFLWISDLWNLNKKELLGWRGY